MTASMTHTHTQAWKGHNRENDSEYDTHIHTHTHKHEKGKRPGLSGDIYKNKKDLNICVNTLNFTFPPKEIT